MQTMAGLSVLLRTGSALVLPSELQPDDSELVCG